MALLCGSGPARAETVAGVTAGALSVDSSGSANYTIPIDVPPGVAGMEPGLSLNYKSHGGNGLLGVGWSLGGLSVIHRCAQTIAQDGVNGGVNFDADDRFCLDGQRLVAISGTYGADGTEYRTEIDSFARIISYGTAGTGPESFEVETKSGRILSYGNRSDSRLEADGSATVRLWALDEAADRSGNTMTYHYADDTAAKTFKIDRIEYAGNTTAATLPQSEVRFIYEARPDTRTSYSVGSLLNTTERLLRVETWTDAGLVREYRLAYETSPATARSQMLSVTECDSLGDCLVPVSFDVQGSSPSFLKETVTTSWSMTAGDWNANARNSFVLDYNGDGLDDILLQATGTTNDSYLLTNNGAGFDRTTITNAWGTHSGYWDANQRKVTVIDHNGDGLSDILLQGKGSGNFTYLLTSDGAGFDVANVTNAWGMNAGRWAENERKLTLLDVNGDGLSDILLQGANSNHHSWVLTNTGSGFNATDVTNAWGMNAGRWAANERQLHVFDRNGDGVSDILLQGANSNHHSWFMTNTGSGFSLLDVSNAWGMSKGTWAKNERKLFVFDYNGDGLDDILLQGANNNHYSWILTNTGSDFVKLHVSNAWGMSTGRWSAAWRRIFIFDHNGDGLDDILVQGVQSTYQSFLLTNNGAGFNYRADVSNAWGMAKSQWAAVSRKLLLLNYDGDGRRDILLQGIGASQSTFLLKKEGPVPGLVTTITDSLGRNTSLTYTPLTDPAVYTKGSSAAFPEIDLQVPLHVVEEVSSDDGVGGQARTTYAYEGARVDVQGRGFLGFSRMSAVDQQTGIETVTDYRQDFPFIGAVAASETRLADGTKVRSSANTWTETLLNGGKTSFPHVSASTASGFEINDGPGNTAVTTSTTSTSFDAYGNPTLVTATTTGGGETFTTTTTSTVSNNTVDWLLGQVDRLEVTNTLPDLTSDTRVTAFDYAPVTGLLSQEVIEPDLPAFTLTTDFGHDAFGNLTGATVSGTGIASRTTSTGFSVDGRFATSASNALSHSETRAFDARFGTVTSLTGPNGITTTWSYDGFGRQTKEVRADGSETRWSYDLCVAQCPAGGVYAVSQQDFNTASGTAIGPRQLQYFDALNRAFRSETEGFDGTLVYADTSFNARGEVVAVTRPTFDGTAAQDIQSATSTYDVLSRTLTVTQPDAGVESTAYAGLTVTLTNALNQTQTRKSNAIGQLVEVTDNLNTKITYLYDPFGNLEETDAGGVVTTMAYDIRGLKTSMSDPDMGVWLYDYDRLGQLETQTDPKGQTVTLTYDLLGRVETRDEVEGLTQWTYDTAAKGIGKLQSVTAPGGYLQAQSYDSLGRPGTTTTTIDGVNYATTLAYDTSGRPEVLTYPSGFAVKNAYNSRGFLSSVSEDGGTTTYWQADTVNAEGQVTQETFGNGLVTTNAYDPQTARIDSILTTQGATTIQDLAYDFDKLGNLKKRSDLRQDREEAFLYDGLNRLTTTTLTDTGAGGGTLSATTYSYDTIGNILTKSDVAGIYGYGAGGAGPHAVTSAGGKTYKYDANGNLFERLTGSTVELSVTWSSFNKPTDVTETASGNQAAFTYGPDRARFKQHVVDNSLAHDVVYIGSLYERRIRLGNPDELVHYIAAGATVAIHTIHDDNLAATNKTRYLHRDHLGSVDTLTGETGAVIERLSYDPHGKRRLSDWQAGSPVNPNAETPRGFTGHEHLDSVGLIHMNGRVYDPTLGRFLSTDRFVPDPTSTQSFNRYSYVHNNPLSYTDPSGFYFEGIGSPFDPYGDGRYDPVANGYEDGRSWFEKVVDFFRESVIGQAIAGAIRGALLGIPAGPIGVLTGAIGGFVAGAIGAGFNSMFSAAINPESYPDDANPASFGEGFEHLDREGRDRADGTQVAAVDGFMDFPFDGPGPAGLLYNPYGGRSDLEDLLEGASNFASGFASYFGGLWNFGRRTVREVQSWFNPVIAEEIAEENELVELIIEEMAYDPELRSLVIDSALDYVSQNKARIAGRAAAGVTVTSALGLGFGGAALTAAAVTGDVEETARQLVRAGEIANDLREAIRQGRKAAKLGRNASRLIRAAIGGAEADNSAACVECRAPEE